MVWQGWELTILESIALTVLVGLSVDYSIHVATSWLETQNTSTGKGKEARNARLQYMLTSIGISVTSAGEVSCLCT